MSDAADLPIPTVTVNALGWKCPRPIIELARRLDALPAGELIELMADDPAAGPDVVAWCRMRGRTLVLAEPPRFWVR